MIGPLLLGVLGLAGGLGSAYLGYQAQKQAIEAQNQARRELQKYLNQLPSLLTQDISTAYNLNAPEIQNLLNLLSAQTAKGYDKLRKAIEEGVARQREDLARILFGAPTGRVSDMLKQLRLAGQEQLADYLLSRQLQEAQIPANLALQKQAALANALINARLLGAQGAGIPQQPIPDFWTTLLGSSQLTQALGGWGLGKIGESLESLFRGPSTTPTTPTTPTKPTEPK
ncbi:MAG: hypothetical protein QW474_00510 [Candidatus Aenigmatarchaeota archaeon]